MTKFLRAAVIGLAIPAALFAQWPARATSGAPRTADGKINPAGPAPKAADGRPDLSGVWERGIPVSGPVPPASGFPDFRPAGAGPPPPPAGPRPFQDLPSLFPEGLPMQPWAVALRKQRLAENSKDHPDAYCLPLHPVQLHAHPQPRKIVQTPGLVLIVYEANNGLRQIFTDGRPLPKAEDVQPWWYGYSVGKWDGDTLVVESVGWRDNNWIDEQGTPLTTDGKVTERFRRTNYGTLEIEIGINDPKTFTKPWSYKLNQKLMPDTDLIEFICAENNTSALHLIGK